MTEDFLFDINEETFKKMKEKKGEMGFAQKSWNEWFDHLFNEKKENESQDQILERVFQKTTLEKYYESWAQNFALNLENIWNEKSVRELSQNYNNSNPSAALVIGRGPSIINNNHLKILAESNYNGKIVCTDSALIDVLKSGLTPDKFQDFFVVTIDTNLPVKNFYSDYVVNEFGKKIKCLLSTTVPPTTYEAIKKSGMDIFWFHALFDFSRDKTSFNHIANVMTKSKNHHKGLPAIQTGGNVGTSSWILSWSILKSSPVCLIGIDHGYLQDMSWEEIDKNHKLPEGINKNSESFKKAYPTVYNPEFKTYCIQDPIFQYYSNALKEFIPRAPQWVKTINATEGGAIFGKGIECMTFRKFLKNYN